MGLARWVRMNPVAIKANSGITGVGARAGAATGAGPSDGDGDSGL